MINKTFKTNSKLFQTDKKNRQNRKNSRNTSCYPETHLKIQFFFPEKCDIQKSN